MNDLVGFIGALSLAGNQAAEHLFGGLVKGVYMKYLALASTVAVCYLVWALGWGPMAQWDPGRVGVAGVLAGMGSNVLDAVIARVFPKAKEATLSKAINQALHPPERASRPPQPPT